jgi:DNA-binding MarR family transcriptional regulator
MEDARNGPKAASDPMRSADLRAPVATTSTQLITLQWHQERPDLDLENFLLAIYFMRLGSLVDRSFDRHCMREYQINGGDMRLLLALRRSGRPFVKRPTDLFRALLLTSGAITKKVDRLQELGYVERRADPNHSGGFLLHLTKAGLQVVDRATDYLAKHSMISPAMAQFSPEERKAGTAFTQRILAALEGDE